MDDLALLSRPFFWTGEFSDIPVRKAQHLLSVPLPLHIRAFVDDPLHERGFEERCPAAVQAAYLEG